MIDTKLELVERELSETRELLAEAYIKLSGKSQHASDCATSNAPAMMPGPCDCEPDHKPNGSNVRPSECCAMGSYGCQVPMPLNGRLQSIDYCIADIVAALNAANIITIASCCGHGNENIARINLADGRTLRVEKHTRFWEIAPKNAKNYPCGCSASPKEDVPDYCPEHGKTPPIRDKRKWFVHIYGPDELLPMLDEMMALHEANRLNMFMLASRKKDDPFAVAIAEPHCTYGYEGEAGK